MDMSLQSAAMEYASLGEYLRETRINLGLDLKTVAEETRITPSSIRAIEENDFDALPAETFTRGFYALYARMLSLEPEQVLQRYTREKPHRHKSQSRATLPPTKLAEQVGTLAERPSFMPFSFFGLVLLLSLVLGGFLCWYFSWNPATYLSQKLRSLEQSPQSVEQVLESRFEANKPESSSEIAEWQQSKESEQPNLLNLSSKTAVSGDGIYRAIQKTRFPLLAQTGKYLLHADYREATDRLTPAAAPIRERHRMFETGASSRWHARDKMVNIMPEPVRALNLDEVSPDLLRQNDIPISFSSPENLL
jgi:cytoskeletal protein RodZ